MGKITFFLIFLFLIPGAFSSNEEGLDQRDRLKVRTSFPRYRVYYNHQKTIQEVQKEMAEEKAESSPEEKADKS